MRIWIIIAGITQMWVWGACVDPIAFEPPDEPGRLVVNGQITTTQGEQRVRLGWVSGAVGEDLIPIPNAEIMLWEDSTRLIPYRYDEGEWYVLSNEEFAGKPGHWYHIEVHLPGGRRLLSRPELMPPLPEMTRIDFRVEKRKVLTRDEILVDRDIVDVWVDTRIPKQDRGPYLRWRGEEVFIFQEVYYPWNPLSYPQTCYIYDYPDQQNLKLFNGDELKVGDSYDEMVAFNRNFDSTFTFKHYFNVYLSSLTREALEYWEKVDQQVNRVGNIFDAPPAPIIGNIYNPDDPLDLVLGYFEANSEDTIRMFVLPGDFWPARRVPRSCLAQGYDDRGRLIYAPHCFACWQLKGATGLRPSWF
ncbi:MAG: DUF4249 domain-containing protein [Bacteroidota bacterium]